MMMKIEIWVSKILYVIFCFAFFAINNVQLVFGLDLQCNNSFFLNLCKDLPKEGQLYQDTFSPCSKNMMIKKFRAKIHTGEETINDNNNDFLLYPSMIPKFAKKEDILISYNGGKKYWVPHRGKLILQKWNGETSSKIFNFKNLNILDDGSISKERSYHTKFFSQKDGIEIFADIAYLPDLGLDYPHIKILIKEKTDPINSYVYRIEGYCKITDGYPFLRGNSSKDIIDKVFK